MAEKYAPPCRTQTGILDLPDEILTHIFLLLRIRERLPLGRSCHRFKALVFEDPVLLRHLDFSEKPDDTITVTMADIQQYFNNENACQHIRRVNVSNIDCMQPGDPLDNTICRAFNLVELNIQGAYFKDICALGLFLNGLPHLEKLSIDWPASDGNDAKLCRQTLQRPFCNLTYLSVRYRTSNPTMFTSYLSLCPHLEELCVQVHNACSSASHRTSWNSEIKQLRNLKIVKYLGYQALKIKDDLVSVLPDPERWTDFQLCGPSRTDPRGFCIEKDVEVCEELLQSQRVQEFLITAPWNNFRLKWAVSPKLLVKEVVRMTNRNVPEEPCCILSKYMRRQIQILNVDQTKRLLKNPRYEMSSLNLKHELQRCCWQSLELLDLPDIPYEDDQFLIEIGKHCKNLQKLHLRNYWFPKARFDRAALFQMLRCCRNLRDFTIVCNDVDLAEMFALLAKNTELERVEFCGSWMSSLENLIRQCTNSTTIICNIVFETEDDFNEAVSTVKRIKGECCRPNFQIQVLCQIIEAQAWHEVIETVSEDFPQNEPLRRD